MNNFNLETTKFRILLITICSLFVFLIWQAFYYLPQEEENINYTEISSPAVPSTREIIEEESSKIEESKSVSSFSYFSEKDLFKLSAEKLTAVAKYKKKFNKKQSFNIFTKLTALRLPERKDAI